MWDVRFRGIGEHPAVILTINRLRARLSSVSVVAITGTAGPASTHVALGVDAGVAKYNESYANVTDLHTVPVGACRRRRGLLAPGEMRAIEEALRISLGLQQ